MDNFRRTAEPEYDFAYTDSETSNGKSDYELAYEAERGKPMPSEIHSLVEARIGGAFDHAYSDLYNVHVELSLQLSTGNATPDVCLLPAKKLDWFHDTIKVSEAPLLVVEILSPTQGMEDLTEKMDIYFGAGVKSYWVVIPTFKIINVVMPDRSFQTFTGGIVKDPALGIELDMDKVFR